MTTEVTDNEVLHRRVHPTHVKPDGSVSSAAFTDDELSVDRASLRTPEVTLEGRRNYGIVSLVVGEVRSLKQEVRADPTLLNPAHALVLGHKPKSLQRQLARSARWVVRVADQCTSAQASE